MKQRHEPPIDWWFIEDPANKSLKKQVLYEMKPDEEFTFIVVLKTLAVNQNQLFVTNIKITSENKQDQSLKVFCFGAM